MGEVAASQAVTVPSRNTRHTADSSLIGVVNSVSESVRAVVWNVGHCGGVQLSSDLVCTGLYNVSPSILRTLSPVGLLSKKNESQQDVTVVSFCL